MFYVLSMCSSQLLTYLSNTCFFTTNYLGYLFGNPFIQTHEVGSFSFLDFESLSLPLLYVTKISISYFQQQFSSSFSSSHIICPYSVVGRTTFLSLEVFSSPFRKLYCIKWHIENQILRSNSVLFLRFQRNFWSLTSLFSFRKTFFAILMRFRISASHFPLSINALHKYFCF